MLCLAARGDAKFPINLRSPLGAVLFTDRRTERTNDSKYLYPYESLRIDSSELGMDLEKENKAEVKLQMRVDQKSTPSWQVQYGVTLST